MFCEFQNNEQDAMGACKWILKSEDQNNLLEDSHLKCKCCENQISLSIHLLSTMASLS